MLTPWAIEAVAVVFGVVVMTSLWLVQRRTSDATLVDAGWAVLVAAQAVGFGLLADGAPVRRWTVALVGGLWGGRLAFHLVRRALREGEEDGRYRRLREEWGDRAQARFFWWYEMQVVVAAALAVPFLLAATDPNPRLGPVEIVAVILGGVGVVGEAIADRQLDRWRSDPTKRGRTCREGLWRYSRHPNYFFEWLTWCGIGLFALPSPYGWLGLVSPAAMLLLLTRVTGIPPSEEQAVERRGDDYRRYQRSTSAFFPWFPKEEGAA